jgi:hypothetical protein
VKKPFIFLVLLCSSLLSFSQQEITNESHPFQVLFVDSASYIGKDERLKQFDFLDKYDLIRNRSEVVLLHYSGKVSETKERILNFRELSEKEEFQGYIERPLISDPKLINNKSVGRKVSATGVIYCNPRQNISITYPSFDRFETPELFGSETLYMCWKSHESKGSLYIVSYKNIFDEVIFIDTVSNSCISTPVDKLITNEGLLIVNVVDANNNDISSGDWGFRVNSDLNRKQPNLSMYSILLDALRVSYTDQPEAAQQLFLFSISNSNQDPRFIKLYEDFLERNPQFKADTE